MANTESESGMAAWPNARARLMMWSSGAVSGSSLSARQAVVLEDANALGALRATDVLDPDAIVFAPADIEGALPYEGSIAGPGTEFIISEDFFLQVQTYAISEYVSVVGPTLVRLSEGEDLDILQADVHTALQTGSFPEFLTNPIVQLADLPALGVLDDGAGPDARLWVGSDGSLAVSPSGDAIGTIGDNRSSVWSAWSAQLVTSADVGALGARIGRENLIALQSRVPALQRFLAAVEGIRNLRARGLSLPRVSGFGTTLLPGIDPAAGSLLAPDLPFLMSSVERHFLVHPVAHRVFEVDRPAAAALEAVLHLGDAAAEVVGSDAAASAARALRAQGIDVGEVKVAT